jgi:lysine 2,3-aminomutase
MPNYIISWSTNKVVLRNYEGVITTYKEPDSYEAKMCDRDCENCKLDLPIQEGQEEDAIGIEKLLSDTDDAISLIPEDNERMIRREEDAG